MHEYQHYDTIIIGAGISGLACAGRLLEHFSYQSERRLLVLEARDRVGGRIESLYLNENRLDTGANWIHGVGTKEKPNPIVGIVPDKKSRKLTRSVSFRPPNARTDSAMPKIIESETDHDWVRIERNSDSTQSSNCDLVIPSDISGDIFGALWALIGSLHENATRALPENAYKTSMLAAITQDKTFKAAFQDVPVEYHQILKALPQFLENIEAAPLLAKSAEHSADHPGVGLLEFCIDDFEGEQVFLCDGYTAVVDEVGKQVIAKGLVRLGVEVKKILWDSNPIVIATTEGHYTANRVVCTLPLGVLQSHLRSCSRTTSFFEPTLPFRIIEAVNSLGFGTLDKIFLVYKYPWWREEPYTSILKKGLSNGEHEPTANNGENIEPDSLWSFTDELGGLEIGPDGSVGPGFRALSIINLHALTGFPVLSSFISCANAVHIENLSDEAASMIVHRSLTACFGREPPLPDVVHVTRWAQDKYSCGSYSHMITGLSKTFHREAFQKPIRNRQGAELRFSGEHTSRASFATVHGALLSGWREADAVLESEARISS